MAYPVRQRDPLLDQEVQLTLMRRAREGLGVALAGAGLALAALLISYHPNDPSWLAATDEAPRNWLGATGATLAAPLMLILGWGAFALAAGLTVWGLRFAAHWHSDRALPRALFVAAWVPVCALYGATVVPPETWGHGFGMGGLLGDMVLGVALSVLPVGGAWGINVVSVLLALLAAAMGAWVLGFTRDELRRAGALLLTTTLTALGQALHLLRRGSATAARAGAAGARAGAAGAAVAGHRAGAAWQAHRAARAADADAEAEPRRGLWLWRRSAPEAEEDVFEAPAPAALEGIEALEDGEDRVRGRIAQAVRTRVRRAHLAARLAADEVEAAVTPLAERAQPVLTRTPRISVPDPVTEPTPAAEAPEPSASAPPEPEALFEPAEDTAPEVPAPQSPSRVVKAAGRKEPAAPAAPVALSQGGTIDLPPLDLLTDPATIERHHLSDDALEANARALEAVLDDYGVKGEIVSVRPGPVVTMYELEPAPGLKASRVIGLADDIARSMSALSARVSTVPGRSVIGIELPNDRREKVVLREILSAPGFADTRAKLALALGKDIGGAPVVADLAKMPHLLIAGTTGSGKSVAINTMILSLLYKLTPEECRLIMIDPKMLELSVYDGIPHLLSPVVTDPKKAVVALKWVVAEMEERYRKMSRMGVRNIEGYNGRVDDALAKGELFSRTVQTGFDDETGDPVFETEESEPVRLPYIVVVVDEMADLMMVAGKEIEACIQRLAQMARASGIHLVMATQRPSVDVITGTIKANFPTRISFHVTSKIDSRTILGEMGAEQLLGMGDMLYMAGGSRITRVHGPFCSDEEVEEIVTHLKQFGPPEYASSVLEGPSDEAAPEIDAVLGLTGGNTGGEDALYDQAVAIVAKDRKCSTSYIQRKLGIGYNKAARLVEQMEDEGVVTAANHVGKREILVPEA